MLSTWDNMDAENLQKKESTSKLVWTEQLAAADHRIAMIYILNLLLTRRPA